jgi:hypothetical protein
MENKEAQKRLFENFKISRQQKESNDQMERK